MIEDPKYTTVVVTTSTGVHPETLRDWRNRGYITPQKPAKGQGRANLYTKWDLYRIKLMQHLIAAGVLREDAAVICEAFQESTFDPKKPFLCIDIKGNFGFKTEKSAMAEMSKNVRLIAVNLPMLMDAVEARLSI